LGPGLGVVAAVSNELEIAAAASLGGLARARHHAGERPPGSPCANCATPLRGPWCYACGQSAEDFHRSIGKLAAEGFESLFDFDSRIWRTLPDLLFRPGRLTRAFLDGHRAPQVPPLRLFLMVLLAIFVVGRLAGSEKEHGGGIVTVNGKSVHYDNRSYEDLTPAERAKVGEGVKNINLQFGGKPDAEASHWLQDRIARTLANPDKFQRILGEWAERFAFLMLPLSALLLSVLFIFQRRFYLFDHTIFSLHSLSAMGIVLTTAMIGSAIVGDSAFALLLPAPVHLFTHMRGVYQTSVIGTVTRMLLLFIGSVFIAALLVLGLIAVGLNGMGS